MTNPSNYTPVISKKIKQNKFQLYLPDLSDLLGDVINWDGDNGLANTLGICHKYPDDNFLLAIGMSDVQMSPPNFPVMVVNKATVLAVKLHFQMQATGLVLKTYI